MSREIELAGRTLEIKTVRGILRIAPDGELLGLWAIVRKEARTNAEVRKMCGGVARETLKRWRARETDPFPAPVMSFSGSGRGGAVEIWERTAVEAWWQVETGDEKVPRR